MRDSNDFFVPEPPDIRGTNWVIRNQPSRNRWQWCLNDDWLTAFPAKRGPSWFHRLMQKWILGIRWRELP